MAIKIENRGQLFEFVRDRRSAYSMLRQQLIASTAADACYFEGLQWIQQFGGVSTNSLGRLMNQINPDRADLRVTANHTTRLTQKVVVQTYPQSINIDVPMPDRDVGVETQHAAQVIEDLANIGIDRSSLLSALRVANNSRGVVGVAGVGLTIQNSVKSLKINGREVEAGDRSINAFPFDVTDLILDPGMCEYRHDLWDHDFVIHESSWTADKAERVFGITLDRDDLKTIGQLEQFRMEVNRISDRKLFDHYRQYSKTKGVMVLQIHVKGDSGRFDDMFIVLDQVNTSSTNDDQGMLWINEDNPRTPFGGDGMPLTLIHGHRRSKSIFSMSEPRMLRDDQNRLNILETLFFRHIQKMSGLSVMVDKRSLVQGMSQEEAKNQYTNRVGGIWWYDSKGPHQKVLPPQIMQMPAPSPMIPNSAERYIQNMQMAVHRTDPTQGLTKSHVPDSSFQTAIEQADQVGATRIAEDLTRVGHLVSTMVHTDVASVHMQTPTVLGRLHDVGFREEDFAAILRMSPLDIGLTVKINPSTVRHRSYNAKKQDLDSALQLQAITPLTYRVAFSDDLDTAITQDDKLYTVSASRAAVRVMGGAEWTPIPLGEYGEVFVNAFRKGTQDRRIKDDPEALDRLQRAIQGQTQVNVQDAIASDPALSLQQQQIDQQAQQAAQAQPSQPQGLAPGATASVADLLANIA